MSYEDFTLLQLEKNFGIAIQSNLALFSPQPPTVALTPSFLAYLDYSATLALSINTEKARSEMIIAPILIELKRLAGNHISLFSGTEFNVDSAKGLNGFCDFIISLSAQQLYVQSPIAIIFEAKNENIKGGLAQCIAAAIAAQIFNRNNDTELEPLFGAVTTGNQWKFLRLQQNEVYIDSKDYYIDRPEVIMGILLSMTQSQQTLLAIP